MIFKAFPRECIGSVFGVLETAAEMNSDIQLKSLQCLSPLMANYNDLYGMELIRVRTRDFCAILDYYLSFRYSLLLSSYRNRKREWLITPLLPLSDKW